MRDDYLWDASGEPDPEIQRLENALRSLRHNGPAPEFPVIAADKHQPRQVRWLHGWFARVAVAAACAAVAVIGGFLVLRPKLQVAPSEWTVTNVDGGTRLGSSTISIAGRAKNLGIGQLLETDSRSRASIRAEATGEIQVEPQTRLRVLSSKSGLNRFQLERGAINVRIWAEPGEFVVDTPSAVAVDLGCVYTLQVNDAGDGLLRTSMGWVGFKLGDRESFIPAGAACATRKKTGPGTPYFEDTAQSFRDFLTVLDVQGSNAKEYSAALQAVLEEARPQDALTLWHLLPRVPESDRERVYDRLAQFAPPPAGVTRQGILHLDRQMLDLWWNALDLGDISLWRHWERSWPQNDVQN
ncbi:MAG TPA: FecR domain-containing protein [Candidatus Angelobacter sp.]|nr:FecR domain-containing protein [Candidatus Angelobacter sp.]